MFCTCLQDRNTSYLFLKVFSILRVPTDKYYLYANLSIATFQYKLQIYLLSILRITGQNSSE